MKIYVVIGSTGEYSDRMEWVACAFHDEEKAKQVVTEWDAQARVVAAWRDDDGDGWGVYNRETGKHCWDDRSIPTDYPTHPDPHFSCDYRTTYAYTETELLFDAQEVGKETK